MNEDEEEVAELVVGDSEQDDGCNDDGRSLKGKDTATAPP